MTGDNTRVGIPSQQSAVSTSSAGRSGADASREEFYDWLRGLAIIGVVMLHAVRGALEFPDGSYNAVFGVAARQVLNMAVPAFLFISGYFSVFSYRKSASVTIYYRARFRRLLIPYLFWSAIGIGAKWLTGTPVSVKASVYWMCTGQCVEIYYYFIVLFQLILVTPLLMRWKEGRVSRFLPLAIYAVSISFLTALSFSGSERLRFADSMLPCVYWILFYHVGILMNSPKERAWVKAHGRGLGIGYAVTLVLSMALSVLLWIGAGVHARILVMQVSPWSSAASILLLLFLFSRYSDRKFGNGLLPRLGGHSFGIYLIHMIGIMQAVKLLCRPVYGIQPLFVPLTAALTLAASVGIIVCVRRAIGVSRAGKIGF
jgi:peptidoglycan/LPS O-acetylase OafA/YrhL